MVKLFFLLKRKPGLSREQFRQHFEDVHVRMAERHFTHLMSHYVRNYITEASGGGLGSWAAAAFDYDCISEWTLPDQAALADIWRIFAVPEVGGWFRNDEDNFLDREATLMIRCEHEDLVDTGTGALVPTAASSAT